MLHVRVVTPPSRKASLLSLVAQEPAVFNLVVHEGAVQEPAGDLVLFDVPPEAANDLIEAMRGLDLDTDGSISILRIDAAVSRLARAAEETAPGLPAEAVLWAEVESRVRSEARASPSFYAFMIVAALIAAIAILIDSAILIVGAMVVGPDYGPVAGIAAGLSLRRSTIIRRGSFALLTGIAAGIIAAYLLGIILELFDQIPAGYLAGERPQTGFITDPDLFAVLVAAFAGVAGALSLTEAKSGALVGVFISVTTIPAIADIGMSLATDAGQAAGAALQLLINVTTLIAVGAATITVQRALLRRMHRRRTYASFSTNDSS